MGLCKLMRYEIPSIVPISFFTSLILYLIAFPFANRAIDRQRAYNACYYLEDKAEYGEKVPWSAKVAIFLEYISDLLLLTSLFGFLFL